jgi:hypothetical protein
LSARVAGPARRNAEEEEHNMSHIKTSGPDTGLVRTSHEKISGEASAKAPRSISMHADVAVWEDCCSCEAEPYWVEAFAGDDETGDSDDVPQPAADRGVNR